MIDGPLLLVAGPLAAAVLTFLLRRFVTLTALIAALVPLGLAILALRSPISEPQDILGRIITFSSGDRIGIAYLFIISAAIFLGVWRSSPGWSYYPIALLSLGALSTALIYRPPLNETYTSFAYSALFVAVAAALAVFPLQGGKPGITGGVLRFIALATLALPAFLLSDWTLGQFTQSPDSPQLSQATIILLGLGFTFLLAIFPFHSWVPAVSREAPPLSTAFVLSVLLGAVWILLLDVLNGNRLITNDPRALELLRGAGLLMAGLGAGLAWTQSDFGRLLAYGALADMGAILYAVGLASSTGLSAAFVAMLMRPLGIGLMALGLALARERHGNDAFSTLTGLVWRLPWTSVAIVAGGLSLAGFPPLPGFAGHWGLVQATAGVDPRAAVVLLAASVSIGVGMLRGLREMLYPLTDLAGPPQRERRSEAILIIAALALCLIVGLFPGMFAPLVREFVATYTFAAH
ncbi:MAG TPA: proton-conducting transporter membrane subunit [Anaerolineae bacterium]|nr:proton-conducting transporter membrane subunit [Anaerolineae bacterium]